LVFGDLRPTAAGYWRDSIQTVKNDNTLKILSGGSMIAETSVKII